VLIFSDLPALEIPHPQPRILIGAFSPGMGKPSQLMSPIGETLKMD